MFHRILSTVLLWTLLGLTALQAQEITVSVPDTVVDAGVELEIPVTVSDIQAIDEIYSGEWRFTTSSGMITLHGVNTSSGLLAGSNALFNATTGRFAFAVTDPLEGSGLLMTLNVSVSAGASKFQESVIGFSDAMLNEGEPVLNTSGGTVRIRGISLTPKTPSSPIIVGDTFQFDVTGDVVEPVTWTSSDSNIAAIDENGLMTGVSVGTVRMYVEDADGQQDSTNLFRVEPESLLELTLSVTSTSVTETLEDTIEVTVSDLTGLEITSGQFDVNYPSNKIEILAVLTEGTILEERPNPVTHQNGDNLSVAFADTEAYEGEGALIKIHFRVPRNASGTATFSPSNVLFNESIEASTQSGVVTILSAPVPVVEPERLELTKGEAGQFNVISGGTSPYTWSSSDESVATIDEQTGELQALSRGVTYVAATDADNFSSDESEVIVNDITVSLSNYSLSDGGTVEIPVETMDMAGLGIFSYEIEIDFDPDVVAFDGVSTDGTLSEGLNASGYAEEGTAKIAAASATPIEGEGTLINLVLKRSENPGSSQESPLTLKRIQFNEPGPDTPTATKVSGSVSVEGVNWTGDGDGASWEDSANWSSNTVPDSSSDVLITLEPGMNYTITTSSEVTVSSLLISSQEATLSAGQNLNILTSYIQSSGTLTGPGTLNVSGLMSWQGGTISGSGEILADGGLNISEGTAKTLSERRIIIPGSQEAVVAGSNLTGTNGAVLEIREDATLDLTTESTSNLFAAGSGGATIVNAGMINKTAGTTSTLTIDWDLDQSGTINMNQENATLRLTGSLIDNGGLYRAITGVLDFSGSGVYELTSSSSIVGASEGTVQFGAGSENSTITILGSFNVEGTTRVRSTGSGTAHLIVSDAANVTALGDAALIVGGNRGTLEIQGGDPVTIGDLGLQSDGTLLLNGPLTVLGDYLQNHASAVLDSDFDLFVDGSMTWSGGTMTGSGTTYANNGLTISGSGDSNVKTLDTRTLVLAGGTGEYTGDRLEGGNGGQLIIEENLDFNIRPTNETSTISIFEGSTDDPMILNKGAFASTRNNNLLTIHWQFENEGTIHLGTNNLVLEAEKGILNSGTVSGAGNIIGNLENNGGILAPGTDTDAGQLQFDGTLTQDSNGVMKVKIGGTSAGNSYDQIRAAHVDLDGTLEIDFINNFTPQEDDRFQLIVWPGGTRTGNFAEFIGLDALSIDLSLRFDGDVLELYDGSFTPSPSDVNISVTVDTPPFQRIGRSVPISASVSNSGGTTSMQRIRTENFTYSVPSSGLTPCPTNDAYENLKCRMERFGVTPPPPEEGSEEEYPFLLQVRFPQAIGGDGGSGGGGGDDKSSEFTGVLGGGSSFDIGATEQCETNEPVNAVLKTGAPITDDNLAGCAYDLAKLALDFVPGYDCFKLASGIGTKIGEGIHSGQFDLLGYMGSNMVGAINCAGDAVPATKAIKIMKTLNDVANKADGIKSVSESCSKSTGEGSAGGSSASSQTTCIGSYDPNDKVGPTGVLDERYIASGDSLPYVVFFENLDEATAAAQTVIIYDTLNVELMDLESFSFGMIAWSDTSVSMTPNVHATSRDVDLRPEMDLILRIEADLDPVTGVIEWVFSSLDPQTMEPTMDPLAGFLPPNVTSPEGEGLVSYFVSLKEETPSDTQFGHSARIIFDENDPIDTPVWSNTLDTEPPVSEVNPLDEIQSEPEFQVSWDGTDDASGIRAYTIYVSENGGEPTVWLAETSETSATFTGTDGNEYAFYSTAVDWTDNEEMMRDEPDASTVIQLDTSTEAGDELAGIPRDFVLDQNYPNPFNPATVIRFGLPQNGDVLLEVYNMVGHRVATLVNERKAAGWHEVTFNASSLASGVYVYRIQAGEYVNTKKLILVK